MTRAGPTLAELREYLRSKLNGYKMPTISRVVKGELPKPARGRQGAEEDIRSAILPSKLSRDS